MIPLITIEGPTASGKSNLAIKLAQELGSQIISADSRQVYRYMNIGTAKPTQEELNAVPHHLVSIINPDESYNVGRFCEEAGAIIEDLLSQGITPIVCGGTGLYITGLLTGIFPQVSISEDIRLNLKQRLDMDGLPELYRELISIDPQFAARISSKDKQRILRGLEVYEATGMPISQHWLTQGSISRFEAFRILIDPPREVLYSRINKRMDIMLEMGLLDEIRDLLAMGFTESAPGLNSLGYKEFLPHLKESASLSSCVALAAQHSRNYAKRQCTWARKYKFDLTLTSNEYIISEVSDQIQAHFG